MRRDWTVAFDDLLTHRLRCCTVCGRAGVVFWGIAAAGSLTIAYSLCQACYGQDPSCAGAVQVLEARYET